MFSSLSGKYDELLELMNRPLEDRELGGASTLAHYVAMATEDFLRQDTAMIVFTTPAAASAHRFYTNFSADLVLLDGASRMRELTSLIPISFSRHVPGSSQEMFASGLRMLNWSMISERERQRRTRLLRS